MLNSQYHTMTFKKIRYDILTKVTSAIITGINNNVNYNNFPGY